MGEEMIDSKLVKNDSRNFLLDKVFFIAFGISILPISFLLAKFLPSLFGNIIPLSLSALVLAFVFAYSIKNNFLKSVKVSFLSIISIIVILFFAFGISDFGDFLFFYVPFLLFYLAVGMFLLLSIGFGVRKLLKIDITTTISVDSPEIQIEGPKKFSKINGNWKHYILSFIYFWILSLATSVFLRFWSEPYKFADYLFKYSGVSKLLFNPVIIIISLVIVIVVYFSFLKGIITGAVPIVLLFFYLLFFSSGESQGYGMLAAGVYFFYLICLAGIGVFIRIFYNVKNNPLKIFFFVLPFIILLLGFTWFAQGMNNPTEFYCDNIGSPYTECYYHLAINTKDESFCNKLGDSGFESRCQVEVALLNGVSCMDFDWTSKKISCFEKTEGSPKKEEYSGLCSDSDFGCHTQWAVFLEDRDFCNIAEWESVKESCFSELAIHMEDSSLCDNLVYDRFHNEDDNNNARDKCLQDFAFDLRNAGLTAEAISTCDKMVSSSKLDFCKSRVNR